MNRRDFIKTSLAGAALAALPRWGAGEEPPVAPAKRPPNIVFIITDDLGVTDLSCYGGKQVKTPEVDRLAAEGVQCNQFYATAPVCSPTRASLFTGCYPKRVGMHVGVVLGKNYALHPDEVTLAEVLRARGYATHCIGKWHLGELPGTLPTEQGFDSYFGMAGANHGSSDLYEGAKVIERKGAVDLDQLTQRYTAAAVKVIEQAREPFFLYLPHNWCHWPFHAAPQFRKSPAGKSSVYDMVKEIDWSVGQVMAALKKRNLDENTLVVFTSDNGGYGSPHMGSLRGGKEWTWEGGFRVPCLVRWPGRIKPGSTTDDMAFMFDWLPTLCQVTGAALPQRTLDGKDIWPLLTKQGKTPHDHFVYYSRAGNAAAIRAGNWKLHVLPPDQNNKGPVSEPLPWLYDLAADPGEATNVAAKHPDVVVRLRRQLEETDAEITRQARPALEGTRKRVKK